MHVISQHEDSAIITIVGNQQILLNESMEIFRQDMNSILNNVIQGQNDMKSELMLVKEELSLIKESKSKQTNVSDDDTEEKKETKKRYEKEKEKGKKIQA